MYQYFICHSETNRMSEVLHWIGTHVENYAFVIKVKCDWRFEEYSEWNVYVTLTIGSDTIEIFKNRNAYTILSFEDLAEGNVVLEFVVSLLLKNGYEIRCLHLSNIKITP